ncbi:type II secretion system F family protein [Planomonospora sp. ID67723]|uniref:type II secretion system F family protein n=1 Tax=Planomonospora sp. ID67723 TaxID=2738134 RepID=UPI0018C42C4B|nr:type II secretion system F family protein [Planomonospora sp. ID67723]MBG0827264.1 type II secretion system F family protein [Planomonospora sp. ID67723]
MMVTAALLALLAVWLWTGPDPGTLRLERLLGNGRAKAPPPRRWPSLSSLPSRRAEAWRAASAELCQGLAAELAGGRTASEALIRAVRTAAFPDPVAFRPVIAAARDGGDVPAALLAAAPERGGEGLRRLAACWRASVTAGGGLSILVDRVAASLREAEAHRRDVATQLAGARATARLLAGLPVLGLLMAAGLGMRPFSFLFGGPAGAACLVAGVALDGCGLWWTHCLVTRAEQT